MSMSPAERKFMKLAIEAMLLARSEHLDKPDPLVGAVLVTDGRAVDKAYRGQFRDGEHCEYTLLERLLSNVDPRGCTLYVTLEPCNRRNPPKKPCAMRIVEKGIRRVVIGMLDPCPTVHRQGLGYLLDHGVEVRFFNGDLRQVIRQENQQFIAHYEQSYYSAEMVEEATVELGETPRRPFTGAEREETQPVRSATVEDFDYDLIREYLATQQLSYRIPSEELRRDFLKRGFVAISLEDNVFVPTLAGILLFGKDPTVFWPSSVIRATRFEGTPTEGMTLDRVPPGGLADIRGPLTRMVEDAIQFFRRHVRPVWRIEGSRRVQVDEYPEGVIRELLINAVIHRSYLEGRDVTFQIFSDRIVVASPGCVPSPLTLEDLRSPAGALSVRRNPRIADAFARLERMELRALGLPTIYDELRQHGLRKPDFREHAEQVVVTIYGTQGRVLLTEEALKHLSTRQKEILRHIQIHGRITSGECQKRFHITRETANQDFKRLIELGLVERRGAGASTHYVLTG